VVGDVSAAIRILVVDDHPTVIDSIGRLLAAEVDMEVVGAARSGAAAEQAIDALDPDVVVCDIQMGGDADGLRLLERRGRSKRPAFLMLSAYDYPTLYRAAFERGAQGYVLKTSELSEVVAAARTVATGGTAFTSALMRHIRTAPTRPSNREIEVLELVASGAGNDEIARGLTLSLKTVESHIRRMFDRYGVMNRTELAIPAVREGWITVGTGE
jgi:DNA-binding NarL/FixJ family response regulator